MDVIGALPRMILLQRACNVGELALLELRLPEDRVRVVESMLDPSVLLDVVQIDETSRVRIPMGSRQDTPSAQLERLVVFKVVLVLCVEHTVRECLTGTNTEEVASETRAVTVDVVEGGAFLRGYTGAHGSLSISIRWMV